jgi:predicted nucleic acid-binding protein
VEFFYPEMSFHEIQKYKDLVLKKSGMVDEDYKLLLDLLLKNINIVPDERILNNLEEAKKVIAHIDPDDVIFIATKFSIKNSIIWSDDSDFSKQDIVPVLKTKDVFELYNSK